MPASGQTATFCKIYQILCRKCSEIFRISNWLQPACDTHWDIDVTFDMCYRNYMYVCVVSKFVRVESPGLRKRCLKKFRNSLVKRTKTVFTWRAKVRILNFNSRWCWIKIQSTQKARVCQITSQNASLEMRHSSNSRYRSSYDLAQRNLCMNDLTQNRVLGGGVSWKKHKQHTCMFKVNPDTAMPLLHALERRITFSVVYSSLFKIRKYFDHV